MRLRLSIASLVLAAVLGSAVATPASAVVAVQAPTPVVVGNQLIDTAHGTVFTPHGANWPSFEYACMQGWGYSAGFSTAEAAAIASWGINVIRLPLNQSCWLGLPGTDFESGSNSAGYRAAVQSWVGMLNAAGVAVLLDLHWSAPAGYVAAGQRAMADAQSVTFWSSVAGAFATNKSVMFDLFNEPYSRWGTTDWAFTLTWDCWQNGGCQAPVVDDTQNLTNATYPVAGMTSLVAAVRVAGAAQPIFLGGLDYSNDLTGWLAHRPNDTQLVASWHNYTAQRCNTASCWNAEIAPVAAVVPVVATEFGQDASNTNSGYMGPFMDWADAHGVGYMPWAWWDVPYSESHGNSNYALINTDFSPKAPNGTLYHSHLAALPPPVVVPPTAVPSSITLTADAPSRPGRVVVATFTATVTASLPVSGTVTFSSGGVVIRTVPLSASNTASISLSRGALARSQTIVATFTSASAAVAGSASAPLPVGVKKLPHP